MSDVLIGRNQASERLRVMAQVYRDSNHPGKAALIEGAARRVEAIPGIGWTRVQDEEPPEERHVLGWLNGSYGECWIYDHDYDNEALWAVPGSFHDRAPAYWMELPEGPEETNEKDA